MLDAIVAQWRRHGMDFLLDNYVSVMCEVCNGSPLYA